MQLLENQARVLAEAVGDLQLAQFTFGRPEADADALDGAVAGAGGGLDPLQAAAVGFFGQFKVFLQRLQRAGAGKKDGRAVLQRLLLRARRDLGVLPT